MKNAPNHKKAIESATDQGAPIVVPGRFPVKYAAVCSEVLARLLCNERLTSLDAVDGASTTRLAAVVHYLAEGYGWKVVAESKAAGCRDGRLSWVAEYRLEPQTIERAMAAGAAAWCSKVRKARALLRAKAVEAYQEAARLNEARKRRPHPGQRGLFDGEGLPL